MATVSKGTKLLTTADAAKVLGLSVDRVHALIRAKRLPATKFGRIYIIDEKDLAKVKVRKPGRPRKKAGTKK